MRRLLVFLASLNSLLMVCYCARAESQTVMIHVMIQVSDVHDHPIPGAILSAKGNGSTSGPTDVAGKTGIQVSGKQPGDELALILVNPKSLRIYSPWEGNCTVPKSSGFVQVVVGRPGDVAALQNQKIVWSLANAVVQTKKESCSACATPITANLALQRVSKEIELEPSQVDLAIRKQVEQNRLHESVAIEYMKDPPIKDHPI